MESVLVYITTPDVEQARRIGRYLVEKRLAACVNILPVMESLYWWDGSVQNDREAVLLAKTTAAAVEELRAAVVELHPYEVPCIVAIDMVAGHEPFLRWIHAQVTAAGKGTENC